VSVAFTPVRIDLTPPAITTKVTTADGATYTTGTWTNQSVTVTFTCANALAATTCPAPVVLAGDGEDQSATGTAPEQAGNAASATFTGIKVDLTAPTITATASKVSGAPYVTGGWSKERVVVTFTCGDALSGVAGCPAPITLADGDHQSASGTVVDNAGNRASATVADIRVGQTPPTV